MIIEIINTIIICGLYLSLFALSLIMAMLTGNFYRRNGYDGLYIVIVILSIIIFLTIIDVVMIARGDQDYLMLYILLAIFIYFITFMAFHKYYIDFRCEKYKLSHYWLLSIFITAMIFSLSGNLASSKNTLPLVNWLLNLLPLKVNIDQAVINVYWRKVYHIFIYCVLYVVWFRTILLNKNLSRLRAASYSLCLCLLVATIDEWHQSMIPSRNGSVQDVALDFGAAFLMALVTLTYGSVIKANVPQKP